LTKKLQQSRYGLGTIFRMSLLTSILGRAITQPRQTAVVDDRGTWSYGKVAAGAFYVAEWLESACPSPQVGVLLPTSASYPIALLGAWLAGKVAVPVNYLLNESERTHLINDSGLQTIITVKAMLDFIGGPQALPSHVRVLLMEEMPKDDLPPLRFPPLYDKDDLALILYTSGTSGLPKGVMLTHGNLKSEINAINKHIHIKPSDVFLGVLPQFHCFGLTALTMLPLAVGVKVVYTARFVPGKVVGLIREHRPTVIMAVPSMYGALLSVKTGKPEDFSSVRLPVSGGEPLPESVYNNLRDRFGIHLLEGYGLTETSPATNWSLPELAARDSVGTPLPGVRNLIVDDHDKPLPIGTDGHILIAGPIVMKGYYKQPQLDKQVFVNLVDPLDGREKRFFRTGDIGKVDEIGRLYITGRSKEMMIIGGENVFPREIEEVINKVQGVKASAVLGKADDKRGEVAVAFIEMEEGCPYDEAAIKAACKANLASFKMPRTFIHKDELPKNPTGKIQRKELVSEVEKLD
jgi:long-chain acyl-CoA synthetase